MVLAFNRERFGVEVIGRKQVKRWPNADEVIAEIELEYAKAKGDLQAGGKESSDGCPQEVRLSDNDVRVLLYLYDEHPQLRQLADIMAGARIAKETARKSLKHLRTARLVDRPMGERKGNGLTEEGKKLAEDLANRPNSPH
jgi:hypothetical protein